MQIRIYDRNENLSQQQNNYMILGVHSFSHFLSQLHNKKCSTIFIKGNLKNIIHNILWNQYYSYTMIKDINKATFADVEYRNCFIKVGSKTYRLCDCLEWSSVTKIQQQILRYPIFCIQGFMADSSIKFVNIQIGQINNPNRQYDLIFQYNSPVNSYASFGSSNKLPYQHTQSLSKTKPKNPHTKTQAQKSLFLPNQQKQRNLSTTKYSTQKKTLNSKQKPIKNQYVTKKQVHRKNASKEGDKQNMGGSLKQSMAGKNVMVSATVGQMDVLKKEDLTALILHKKEEKIKEYRGLLERKQKQYEQKISQLSKMHEQQVSAIKQQVQQVLTTYKKKNKELRTQNETLTQQSQILSLTNKTLQRNLTNLSSQLKSLQTRQQILQKHNHEYSIKLQAVQSANIKLVEKVNMQQNVHRKQIGEKDRMLGQYKGKYERLMGSIRFAADEMEKENKENRGL